MLSVARYYLSNIRNNYNGRLKSYYFNNTINIFKYIHYKTIKGLKGKKMKNKNEETKEYKKTSKENNNFTINE